MDVIRKLAAMFFGLCALMGAAAAFSFMMKGPAAAAIGPLIAAAIFVAIARGLWPVDKRGNQDRLCNEATEFFNHVNSARSFPAPTVRRIIDKPTRPVLAACEARLVELTTRSTRGYAGTRVKVGSMPFYVGGSAPMQSVVAKGAVPGELAATSKGLMFIGDVRTLDIPYSKIESVETSLGGFAVSSSDLQRPVYFATPNGVLWGALVKNLVRLNLESRDLPAGAQLEPA